MNKSSKPSEYPKRLTRSEAYDQLPEALRDTFDKLCDEYIGWARFYYGSSLVSYSIIMELVMDGWSKTITKPSA